MSTNKIINRDGQEFVEIDDHEFGLGLQVPTARPVPRQTLASMSPLPSYDDLKKIVQSEEFSFGRSMFDTSWITNQNGYGSCAGYGAASALAKSRVIGGQERVDLSGDYAYSRTNGGRDRGSMLDDNMRSLVENGCATKATVPLGGIYRNKYNAQKADAEAKRFRAHEPWGTPDEHAIVAALVMKMPVVIAIHVGSKWRQYDKDGVLIGNDGPGNHCEHLDDVRYNVTKGRFEFREGSSHNIPYFWTHWGHYKTTSRYHMFYAVPSATQDPQGANPE